MSHAIYQTPAMVLRVINKKESNKLVVLYTRDFGLIYVSAQSIRSLASKMKYHIQSYNYIDVDIVRGRELWRLTGAHQRVASISLVQGPWYPLIERLSSMIQRLCNGEEYNGELWDEITYIYEAVDTQYTSIIEVILMTRILKALGYWSGDEYCTITGTPYAQESCDYAKKNKRSLIRKINQSLSDSQL